jgi:hypothetical protein
VDGVLVFFAGLVASYVFFRLKDPKNLRDWERKSLRPAGYVVMSSLFALSGLLLASVFLPQTGLFG